MKKISLIPILIAMMCSGCATLFSPSHDPVSINSIPPGANIFLDGQRVGKTPMTLQVKRQLTPPRLELKQDGYQSQGIILQNTFNTVAILDVFFWPGFIIDAVTGNIMKASVFNYEAELERK